MTNEIYICEYHGDPPVPVREYVINDNEKSTILLNQNNATGTHKTSSWSRPFLASRRIFSDLFLPVGYPSSVGPGYAEYQTYDSIQGLCSYLRGVVATSAVLTAAGVGDAEATAMSAAVEWATRDGLGMIGGLLFSYMASSNFDSHVKEYRLFADVMNDVFLTLDMLAPYFEGDRKLLLLGFATLCRVMCGMAAGATKGAITQHFAIKGNMADLNAKEGTQETLVSLTGMILGIILAKYLHRLEKSFTHDENNSNVNTATIVTWTVFIVLTLLHLWSNYVGVKILRLRTLNTERATVALQPVIDGCAADCCAILRGRQDRNDIQLSQESLLKTIPEPSGVCESLWASTIGLFVPGNVLLGVPLSKGVHHSMTRNDALHYLNTQFIDERYAVIILPSLRWKKTEKVAIMLRVGASNEDELISFLHAKILERCTKILPSSDRPTDRKLISVTHDRVRLLFQGIIKPDDTYTDEFQDIKSAILSLAFLSKLGWDVDSRLYLGFGRWRIEWSDTAKTKKND